MRLRSTLHLAAFELHLLAVTGKVLEQKLCENSSFEVFQVKPTCAIANAGHVTQMQVSISHRSKLRRGREHNLGKPCKAPTLLSGAFA